MWPEDCCSAARARKRLTLIETACRTRSVAPRPEIGFQQRRSPLDSDSGYRKVSYVGEVYAHTNIHACQRTPPMGGQRNFVSDGRNRHRYCRIVLESALAESRRSGRLIGSARSAVSAPRSAAD